MDNENMNQENMNQGSRAEDNSTPENKQVNEVSGRTDEVAESIKQTETVDVQKPVSNESTSQQSSYHLDKEAIPVQKEYISNQQGNSTYGQQAMQGQTGETSGLNTQGGYQGSNTYQSNPYQSGNVYGQGIYTGNNFDNTTGESKKKRKMKKMRMIIKRMKKKKKMKKEVEKNNFN